MKLGAPEEYLRFIGHGYSKSGRPQSTSQKAVDELTALPREKVKQLYEAFENDFRLFGYSASGYL